LSVIKKSVYSKIIKSLLLSLYILFFLFLNIPSITFFFRDPDQGAQLAKAMEILNGFHPFIHIKGNIYGPLVYYFSALGQFLSGGKLIGEVIVILGGYLTAYLIIYYLIEKITGKILISLLLLTIALTLLPRFYKYYIVLGPAVFLLALYYFVNNDNSQKKLFFLSAGTAITALFRIDFGVYSIVVALIAIVIYKGSDRSNTWIKCIVIYFAFLIMIVLPWIVLVIILSGSLKPFLELFPIIKNMATDLSLPIPVFTQHQVWFSKYNNFSLLFWAFRILPYFTLIILYFNKGIIEQKKKNFIILTSIYTAIIFIQALHRTSFTHLRHCIPLTFILIGWLIGKLIKNKSEWKKFYVVPIIMYLIILLSGWTVFMINNRVLKRYKIALNKGVTNFSYISYSNADLRIKFKKNMYIKTAAIINKYSDKNEPVMFFPIESQLYYFSERMFKKSMGMLGPGRLNTEDQQVLFFKELINSGTNLMADRPFFAYDKIPERNPRFYYPHLMRLIYAEYKIVCKSGDFIILCRDDRFNQYLSNNNHFSKFSEIQSPGKGSNRVNISFDTVNTFPSEEIYHLAHNESMLYITGSIELEKKGFNKKSFLLGLRKGEKLFTSGVAFTDRRDQLNLRFELFSSLFYVNPGEYELIALVKEGEKFRIIDSNIVIAVI